MEPNSLVVCLADFNWEDVVLKTSSPGPKNGDICTVQQYCEGWITLKEFPELGWDNLQREYDAIYFREIQPPMTIDISELQHQTQTV